MKNELKRMLNNIEKVIAYYNRKSNFGLTPLSSKDQKEYDCLLTRWDFLRAKYNEA